MKAAIITQPRDGIGENTSLGIITLALAKELSHRIEVIIYGRKNRALEKPDFNSGSIKYKFIPLWPDNWITRPLIKLLKLTGYNRTKKLPNTSWSIYHLFYAIQIAISVKLRGCDIIHIHNYFQFISVIRFFNRDAKIVLQMNCEWLVQLDRHAVKRHISKADLVLSCSDFITKNTKERFPELAKIFHTLYNGVDINEFKRTHSNITGGDKKKILFIGRVSPEKGVHILVDAFNVVSKEYPTAELEIIGPISTSDFIIEFDQDEVVQRLAGFYNGKDYYSYIRSRIAPENADKVKFHGAISHSALTGYYNSSDAVVFPSVWNEPFGIPVAEAMASEVPIITTISGGIPEIVENGRCGILVERDNATELSGAIIKLFKDQEERIKLARAGRERVCNMFSWEVIGANLYKYYESVCNVKPQNNALNEDYLNNGSIASELNK